MLEPTESWTERLVEKTIHPVVKTKAIYWVWLALLILTVAWGLYAYSRQLRDGLIVTDMRDRISWGLYISSLGRRDSRRSAATTRG